MSDQHHELGVVEEELTPIQQVIAERKAAQDETLPKLVACPRCGSERLARPGSTCPDCRRDASVLRAAVDTLRVTHPSLAVQLRQMAERFEGSE